MSKSKKRLEPSVLFVDRSLGAKKIPSELRARGYEVRVHDDLLSQDAADEDWLKLIGKNGWIGITRDKNIRYQLLSTGTCPAV